MPEPMMIEGSPLEILTDRILTEGVEHDMDKVTLTSVDNPQLEVVGTYNFFRGTAHPTVVSVSGKFNPNWVQRDCLLEEGLKTYGGNNARFVFGGNPYVNFTPKPGEMPSIFFDVEVEKSEDQKTIIMRESRYGEHVEILRQLCWKLDIDCGTIDLPEDSELRIRNGGKITREGIKLATDYLLEYLQENIDAGECVDVRATKPGLWITPDRTFRYEQKGEEAKATIETFTPLIDIIAPPLLYRKSTLPRMLSFLKRHLELDTNINQWQVTYSTMASK